MIETHASLRPAKAGVLSCLRTLCAAALALGLMAAPLHAATPEEQAVLAPFQKVLDSIGQHNPELARANLLPGGMATLLRNGKPIQMSFETFLGHLKGVSTHESAETMHDPIVHIDNDVAVIWAPYNFTVDGRIDHCGTDIANLVKINGRWLVSGIADNGRKDCPAQ